MKRIGQVLWNWVEIISVFFLKILFAILRKELTPEIKDNFIQFVKFGIVGVTNTVVAQGGYMILLFIFQKCHILPSIDYVAANILAWIISVAWAFLWNNKYVFVLEKGEKRSTWKALLKTYVSYSFTGLFLGNVLVIIWVQLLHVPKMIAPLLNIIVNVPINFVINKFWAFRKEKA